MNQMDHQSHSMHIPSNFMAIVRTCANGFILTVNNMEFVIQGEGDREKDWEMLVDALSNAYTQNCQRPR